MPRPFGVRGFAVLGPLSFIVAALIVYWSGWGTMSWLLGLQIVLFAVYVAYVARRRSSRARLAQDVRASLWLIGLYALVLVASWLGTLGGRHILEGPWDSVLVAGIALAIYYWGERSACRPRESRGLRTVAIDADAVGGGCGHPHDDGFTRRSPAAAYARDEHAAREC